MKESRSVLRVLPSLKTVEGGGFVVHRAFPSSSLSMVDPFLLLDEFGPVNFGPGEAPGLPDHPHRGFETVTVLLAGEMEHRDSFGNHGSLRAGDVQWMTTGSGLVHQEMPSDDFRREGGKLHGFQLWVNLPKDHKMVRPAYQDLRSDAIPTFDQDGVRIRVIAGEAGGVRAQTRTVRPVSMLHVTLAPGATWTQPVPPSQNALAYTISGEGRFGGSDSAVPASRLLLFENDGHAISTSNSGAAPFEFLLLTGEPLNEPVARYGPFVMNTEAEIRQAFEDFRSGKMGHIEATTS
ncbi:MAG TPA: pirin family protein [Bryobacteraceae bacterium]|nr:pirin family protein [Bryobacteraceae bacterium]